MTAYFGTKKKNQKTLKIFRELSQKKKKIDGYCRYFLNIFVQSLLLSELKGPSSSGYLFLDSIWRARNPTIVHLFFCFQNE